MAQIIWTEPALSDLNEIAEYIRLINPMRNAAWSKHIFSTVDRLEQFPESGRIPPELLRSKYRDLIVGPCRVFYRVDQDKVYILYVIRGERQLRKYLLEERAQDSR